MRTLLAAISMLSILPLGKFCPNEKELKRSLNLFPVAGVIFGAIVYGIAYGAVYGLPPVAAAAVLTLLPEVLTKGFHLDGLADTADGFLSGRPREKKLAIMRDSRIGSMGVLAIVAVLGLKFAFFASLPLLMLPVAAAVAMALSRSGILWYVAMSRYARPSGLGKLWFSGKPWVGLGLALLIPAAIGYGFFGMRGLVLSALLVALAALWSQMTDMVIGGATGDTIGCFVELAELLVLVVIYYL